MTDSWRVIHEFPNYMISPDGLVRRIEDGKLIVPVHNSYREYVRLFKNGMRYNRSVRKLVEVTYPPRVHAEVFEEWTVIPGFENYEINRFGKIRKTSTKRELRMQTGSGVSVNLSREGKTYRRSVAGLMRLVGFDMPLPGRPGWYSEEDYDVE